MSIRRNLVAAVAVTVLAAGVLAGGTFDGSPSSSADAASTAVAAKPKNNSRAVSPRRPYRPRTGILINDPLSRNNKQVLNQQVSKIIRSVPGGQQIRISEWNIDSRSFVKTAIAAHKRGVSFQILMSGGVASRQNPRTGTFASLKRGFAKYGNSKRRPAMRSWIRGCRASCRGALGIEHAKYMTVTKTGRKANARRIVSVSSANITGAAGANQWNDTFTVVNKAPVFNFFQRLFVEMAKDRKGGPYRAINPSEPGWLKKVWANPYRGNDPVLGILNRVDCKGVSRSAGYKGRTVIRIGQTALSDARGRAIARKLVALQRQGCRGKVVFTLMDPEIRNILRSGGVPARQLVRDVNGDGFYDKYLHTKLLTISGRMGKNRNVHFARTGSENWTQQSRLSDEVGFDMMHRNYEGRYSRWIDGAFRKANANFIPQNPNARGTAQDPFKFVEIN